MSDPMSDWTAENHPIQRVLSSSQLVFEGAGLAPNGVPEGTIWAGQGWVDTEFSAQFHFQGLAYAAPEVGSVMVAPSTLVTSTGKGCLMIQDEVTKLSQGDTCVGQLCFESSTPGLHLMELVFDYLSLPPFPAQKHFKVAVLLHTQHPPEPFDLLDPVSAHHHGQLRWQPARGADQYEVIARHTPMAGGEVQIFNLAVLPGHLHALDIGRLRLPPGTYDWFVLARNRHGITTSSQIKRFTER
ncbi:MAG: hypothetical protein ACE366_22375 [Bradymonadia bacterium]